MNINIDNVTKVATLAAGLTSIIIPTAAFLMIRNQVKENEDLEKILTIKNLVIDSLQSENHRLKNEIDDLKLKSNN